MLYGIPCHITKVPYWHARKSAYDVVAVLNGVNSVFVISYTSIFVECISVLLVTQYTQFNFSNLGDNS
jgi:hypothetical protein